jgi:hypothetical protein
MAGARVSVLHWVVTAAFIHTRRNRGHALTLAICPATIQPFTVNSLPPNAARNEVAAMKSKRERDESPNDESRKKKKKPKKRAQSNTWIFILLGVGFFLTISCVGVAGVGYFLWNRNSPGPAAARVVADKSGIDQKNKNPVENPVIGGKKKTTLDFAKAKKVEAYDTLNEVEATLGHPGERIDLKTANLLLGLDPDPDENHIPPELANRTGVKYVAWYNGNDSFVLVFLPSKKYGDLLVFGTLSVRRDGKNAGGFYMRPEYAQMETSRAILDKIRKK